MKKVSFSGTLPPPAPPHWQYWCHDTEQSSCFYRKPARIEFLFTFYFFFFICNFESQTSKQSSSIFYRAGKVIFYLIARWFLPSAQYSSLCWKNSTKLPCRTLIFVWNVPIIFDRLFSLYTVTKMVNIILPFLNLHSLLRSSCELVQLNNRSRDRYSRFGCCGSRLNGPTVSWML